MSQEQLSKGKFNLVELVSDENGFHIAGRKGVAVKPELLGVFVIKGFNYASVRELILEELLELNGGYKNQKDLSIQLPPEETNAYFFGVGINCGLDLFDYHFFPVVYCHIDESHLE